MADSHHEPYVWNTIQWVLTILATVFVALRVASRCMMKGNGWRTNYLSRHFSLHPDDIAMYIAWVLDIVSAALISVAISKGAGGQDAATSFTLTEQSQAIKWTDIAVGFPTEGAAIGNLSVALLLGRLFDGRFMRWFLPILSVIATILAILSQIFLFVQCTPVAYEWDKTIPGGHCWQPSVLSDFVISMKVYLCAIVLLNALYPIFVISRLNISTLRKIGISFILSLGLFVFASGIFASTLMRISSNNSSQYIYNAGQIMFWGKIHCDMIIIAGCVPTIGPAVRMFKRKISSSYVTSKQALVSQRGTGHGKHIATEPFCAQRTVEKLEPNTYEGIPLVRTKCDGEKPMFFSRSSRQNIDPRDDTIDDLALRCPQPVHIRHHIEVYETDARRPGAITMWKDPRW